MTSIPVAISRIWPNNFKRLCLKNKRLSIEFLLHMSNLEEVQTILSKKDESTSLSFYDIIGAVKKWLLKRLIDLASEHLLLINVFTSFKTSLKSTTSRHYPIFPLIWDKQSWKMPALVRIESLGPSFNTLAADVKYSRRNMQNFQQQLQTALSQKQKIFSAIFIAFIKPTLNLETFW